jgi:hypothetical protein
MEERWKVSIGKILADGGEEQQGRTLYERMGREGAGKKEGKAMEKDVLDTTSCSASSGREEGACRTVS